MQTLLINPSRRRSGSRKRRAGGRKRRTMSALQRKYFGGGRKRRASRRVRTITVRANPSRRSRRRRSRRSFRRNPISLPRLNMGGVTGQIGGAFKGAAGAIVVDAAMGQAARFLPVSMTSRYGADGGMNMGYYATKAALALAMGAFLPKVLPAGMRSFAVAGATGSLTVQAYELLRNVLPPEITLGAYLNPARVVSGGMNGMRGRVAGRMAGGRMAGGRMGAYLNRQNVGRIGASYPAGSAGANMADTRIGEGNVT